MDLGAAARGAGALARERRFKNMAHAVIALQRFGALSQVRRHPLPPLCAPLTQCRAMFRLWRPDRSQRL